MNRPNHCTRRGFLGGTLVGIAGGAAGLSLPRWACGQAAGSTSPSSERSRVALVQGDSRAANIHEALKRIEPDIKRGLASKKRVIIKPNLVSTVNALSATHAGCLEGLLDFFASIYRGEIIVAESAANAPVTEGYDHYGFGPVAARYHAKLIDLDHEETVGDHLVDERHYPQPVRLYKCLMDPEAYIVSVAPMKTHDRAIATLSIKNLTVGALAKDTGFRWGPGSQGHTFKPLAHGGPKNEGIHYNLFTLAKRLRPDLAVLDGFKSMEGNGPVSGTPIDHKIAVAGTDWVATDSTAATLMGFDPARIGYLVFARGANMGQGDVSKLDILGGSVAELTRKYRPHEKIEEQYKWMKGA